MKGISVYESIKPSERPEYDLVAGRHPDVFAWLDKLPEYDVMATPETRAAWLESVDTLKREFPNHMRGGLTGGRRRLFFVFPTDATEEDFDFLLAIIALTKKACARKRPGPAVPTTPSPSGAELQEGSGPTVMKDENEHGGTVGEGDEE